MSRVFPCCIANAAGCACACGMSEEAVLMRENKALAREIRYLRAYGNKDCTAMADAAMSNCELEQGQQPNAKDDRARSAPVDPLVGQTPYNTEIEP